MQLNPRQLEKLGFARSTIRRALDELGGFGTVEQLLKRILPNTPGENGEALAPVDQRHLAAAEKDRVQTAILKKQYRPIDEMEQAGADFGGLICAVIKSSKLSNNEQKKLILRIENLCDQIHAQNEGVEP